jgi:hypothetical protein
MMTDIKKRDLENLLSQGSYSASGTEKNEGRCTKTIGFKVTVKQYETYRMYSKYFGIDDLIKKWRTDLDKIEEEKGRDMEK